MREPEWRSEKAQGGVSWCLKLIIINIIFYVLQHTVQGFEDGLVLYHNQLAQGKIWQLLTFQFLHGDLFHLLINCAMIWFIGRQIEESLGKIKFLLIYLIAGIFGGLLQCMLAWAGINEVVRIVDGQMVNVVIGVVGASAGIFGLMAAFAMLHWNRELTLLIMFILPVNIKAKYLLVALTVIGILGIISSGGGVGAGREGHLIAHGAHLGGMVWGVLFVLLFVQGGTVSGAPPLWNRIRDRQSSSRSRSRKVETIDGGVSEYSKSERPFDDLEEDLIRDKIDPILDKISAQGFSSLTDEERDILEKARERMMR